MATALVPDESQLTQVLPSARLLANGLAIPEIRAGYRRISTARNVRAVTFVWLEALALIEIGARGPWYAAVLVFVLMGPQHVRFAILMHEAAHRLLFRNKKWNDLIGAWLIAYPAFIPIGLYRRSHFAHHRDEFGPEEPDMGFYAGYPCEPRSLRRRLLRDALGVSGYKNFVALLGAVGKPSSRRVAGSILAVQVVLFAGFWLATGAWWAYIVFWWLPWMTQWRVLNRLRAIGEHGGMQRSNDRRLTTHDVRQHWLARFWFVPYNTGWHLAHHVDMGIPWHNLPAFYQELERAGYVNDDLTFESYAALWRCATSVVAP